MNRLLAFVANRWFLLSLAVLVPTGFFVGRANEARGVDVDFVAKFAGIIVPTVLFLMSFTLDSRQLAASLTKPWPVVWSCLMSVMAVPLIAWPTSWLQLTPDFRVGLIIAASVPCTMAAASVWTRRAGGNDAVSLLTTLLTNGLCFAFTPVLIAQFAKQSVALDVGEMAIRLFKTALVPAAAGQVARLLVMPFFNVDRIKSLLGVLAQAGILVIVFGASAKAGPKLLELGPSNGLAVVVMVVSCLVVHLAAAAAAYYGARAFGFTVADAKACLFAGSQKTLPIGILIATDPKMLGDAGLPLAVFPMLAYHMLQLFGDTVIADRLRATADVSPTAAEETSA